MCAACPSPHPQAYHASTSPTPTCVPSRATHTRSQVPVPVIEKSGPEPPIERPEEEAEMATKTVAREAAGEPPATGEAPGEATGEAPGALIIDEKRPEASTITTLACLAAAGLAIVLLWVDAAVFFEGRRSTSAPLLSRVAPAALLPAKLLRDYLGLLNGAATEALASICGGTCCLLYTSPSPRDGLLSRMPSSA